MICSTGPTLQQIGLGIELQHRLTGDRWTGLEPGRHSKKQVGLYACFTTPSKLPIRSLARYKSMET